MWDLVRRDIGMRLLGSSVSTVPVIDKTNYFDILGVYKKDSRRKGIKGVCRTPFFKVFGRLENFLIISNSDPFRLQRIRPHDCVTKINQQFEYSIREDVSHEESTEVFVKIYGTRHQCSELSTILRNEIYLRKKQSVDLIDTKHLYIISDVYYCTHIYIMFRLGQNQIIRDIRDERIPIGFQSHKFGIRDDGSLVYKKKCKPRLSSKDAVWFNRFGQPMISSKHPSIVQLYVKEQQEADYEESDYLEPNVQIIMEPQMPPAMRLQLASACQDRIPPIDNLRHAISDTAFMEVETEVELSSWVAPLQEGDQTLTQLETTSEGEITLTPTPVRVTPADVDKLYNKSTTKPWTNQTATSAYVSKVALKDDGTLHEVEEEHVVTIRPENKKPKMVQNIIF